MKIHVAYDDRLLAWVGSVSSPIRAKNAIDLLSACADVDVQAIEGLAAWEDLTLVHDATYVRDLLSGKTGSMGADARQGEVASLMFQGTVQLMRQLLAADPSVPWLGFSPQGAKHHAAWDHASGFCALNDFAWAARTASAAGLKVLYLDFDAHHGDGVEALCFHDRNVMTASIHEWGIFPGTGSHDHPEQRVFNWALDAESDDVALIASINEVFEVAAAHRFTPDVILVAAGADGHEADPLSSLRYTLGGYRIAAESIAQAATHLGVRRVLVGGAGGYRPDDATPAVWAAFVSTLAEELERLHEISVHDDGVAIQ